MSKFYIEPIFYINTLKANTKYLLLITLIFIVLIVFVLKPAKSLYLVDAIINTPPNTISQNFIKKINSRSFAGGKLLTDINFKVLPQAYRYKLSFKTNNRKSLRSFFLAEINKENGLHLAGNEVRINLLADSLLQLQEKFENLDSINNTNVPFKNPAKVVMNRPNLKDQKAARILAYLEAYLNKPIGSFTLIPEGFAINKVIEDRITDFNTLQYKRQLLLSREQLDKDALEDVFNAIKNARQQLSAILADTISNLDKEKKNVVSIPANKNIYTINADSAMQRLSAKITGLKNNISADEALNVVLAKPSYYSYYRETLKTSKSLSWVYLLITGFGLILPFLIAAYKRISAKDPSKITSKGLIANFRFPSLILPRDEAFRDEVLTVFLQGQKTALNEIPQKDSFAKVILVTNTINDFPSENFELKFAKGLISENKKLLMIDCNVDEPSLLESLGINYKHGLKGYLDKEILYSDISVSVPHEFPGMSFIGAGPAVEQKGDDLLNFINYLEEDLKNEQINDVPSDNVDERISKIVKHYRLSFDYILLAIPHLDLLTRNSRLYKLSDLRIYLLDDNKREIIATEF